VADAVLEEKTAVARLVLEQPRHAAPNPYRWVDDRLHHVGDGHLVATFDEFPQLVRAKALRERSQRP